jgi:two-component system alkaline phosphatase synthesis response regulator PhoP
MAKILVADDDAVTNLFVKSLLEDRGHQVLTAEDGASALQLIRSERPDLVVTDLVMPFRNGLEIIREIREDVRLKRIPVVIISMKGKEDDIVLGLEEGADDYLVKPFHALELVARVQRLLERRVGIIA